MPLLILSLLFTNPAPLDMPKADAYLVRENGSCRLEDRYDAFDLWMSRTVLGRWEDDEGRVFTLSALNTQPPPLGTKRLQTRLEYTASCRPVGRRADIRPILSLLSPCDLAEKPRPPRQMPRGYKDVDYWQMPTNYSTIVCAFKPEKGRHWFLATWELAEGDDYPERMQVFERDLLVAARKSDGDVPEPVRQTVFGPEPPPLPESEREQLRADAHHSVTNYANWRFTDSEEFTVLDDMAGRRDFIATLTNDLHVMRSRYAATLPTHIDGSNVLCVARIFADREEYLDAVDEEMAWTAAYWSPQRRELVAYLPAGGEKDLIRTIRHEAFHQYLSYAASMIAVSPWLNEGYAQYFEDETSCDWGADLEITPEALDRLAPSLPGILGMDYEQFYAGTDRERRMKYRLAWSIACFLEKGAPDVRFKPFKDLKRDYFKELFDSHDMRKATSAAFRNQDTLKLFVSEWKKFWKDR